MVPITCTKCGEKFGGFQSFSEHRTERFQEEPYMIQGRVCLTAEQIREAGRLEQDDAGVWRMSPRVTAIGS